MESMPVVLDISSDEEEEVVSEGEKIIDFDWIKEFLNVSDEKPNEVVLSEVKSVDDDDDDCVVLDGDPENRVTTVDDSPTGVDELVVVGEKGQIACRDYPHPRHLCVKFPFSSTPHDRHCDQCHCYVCDSVAPCLKWGTGLLGADHCHATDKSETWRTLRQNFMLGKADPLPVSTNYRTLGDVTNVQRNHSLPHDIRLLSPNFTLSQISMPDATHTCSPVNFLPQNQASRSVIMHKRPPLNSSLQSQVSRPNIFHGRCRESGSTLLRNRYQSHSVPQHVLGVRNHGIRRVQRHVASILGPQFLSSLTLPMNHSTHGASSFSNCVSHACATGFSNNKIYHGENNVYVPQNLLYPYPCSQPENLSSVSNRITNTGYETQACYHSYGSQNLYAYSVQGNNVLSSHVIGLGRNQCINEQQMGCQNENACGNVTQSGTARQYFCQQKHHDASQIESGIRADFSTFDSSRVEDTNQSMSHLQGSGSMNISSSAKECDTQFTKHQIGRQNENVCGNVVQCGLLRQYSYQQKHHDASQFESAPWADLPDFDSSWIEDTNQSMVYLQGSEPMNISSAIESGTQFPGSTDLDGIQNLYAYSVQGNNVLSSHVVGLGRNQCINEQQMGCQNENACGNVTQSGTAWRYFCQQKHHDASQIESGIRADFSTFDTSRIEDTNQSMSHLQGSGSMNISSSAKECDTQFTKHQIGRQNENVCGNVVQCGLLRQYSYQQKHHDASQFESALRADLPDFDSRRTEDTNQSMVYLQGSESMNISSSAKESGTQFPGSTDLDDIKNWLFNEENSVLDGILASELNIPSPDHGAFDADMHLFDFDNYWGSF